MEVASKIFGGARVAKVFARPMDQSPAPAGGYGTTVAANPQTPPDDPSNTDSQAARDQAAEDERLRLARGRVSTIGTSSSGDISTPNLASKSLLGS